MINEGLKILMIEIGIFFITLIIADFLTKGLLNNIISLKLHSKNRILIFVKTLNKRKSVIGKLVKNRLYYKFNKEKYTLNVEEKDFYSYFGLSCIDTDEFGNKISYDGTINTGFKHEIFENIIEETATNNKGFDKNQKMIFYILIGLGIISLVTLALLFQVYSQTQSLAAVNIIN